MRHSVELGRLMEQKWGDVAESSSRQWAGRQGGWGGRGGRRGGGGGGRGQDAGLRSLESWKADLGREWAVLKLEKLETDTPEPAIEKQQVRRNRENDPIPSEGRDATTPEKQGGETTRSPPASS
jgi:hypothetical protein